jgi:hypothetical protein
MLYWPEYNFAYLHINKTGGTTTRHFLEEVIDSSPEIIDLVPGKYHDRIHEPLSYKLKRFELMGIDHNKLKILTTIRNPYDRWVSLYVSTRRNVIEKRKKVFYERAVLAMNWPFNRWFEEYVYGTAYNDHEHGPQTRYIFIKGFYVLDPFVPNNLHIIKLEDLDKELPKFLKSEFNLETDLKIPKKNVSNKYRDKPVMGYYTEDLKRLVYREEKWIIDNYYPEFIYKE